MKLSEFCIKRPVFTTVMNLILIVIGIVGYTRLEVRSLPKMEVPVVSLRTVYAGASAEVIESQVTREIEEVLASLEGLDFLTSATRDGMSQVVVTFKPGFDIESGMNQIRDLVGSLTRSFPDDVDPPIISKADLNADPSMYISFSDTVRSNMALTDYIMTYIKPAIEQVEGVGSADLWGGREFSLRIAPDPLRMAARGITIQDISNELKSQNVNISGGEIESEWRDYTVVPSTRLQSVDEFKQLILKETSGQVVTLQDVAEVSIRPELEKVTVAANGAPAVIMAVTPQSTANPVNMSTDISALLETFEPTLPEGMTLNINYDQAVFIKASIDNVYTTLIEALLLVVLVVFGFLGSIRGTAVPIVTIPICLLSIFGFLYFMGYSLNNMTLLALVLAIGLVVDDSIVMLENVHRHIEQGMKPMQAAFTASREIGFAIVAMTCTLVAVYSPIGFIEGVTGSIFKEFAFTLAGTVLISGFVALTLSPTMCARTLSDKAHEGRYGEWLERTMEKLKCAYQALLQRALVVKYRVLAVIALLALGGGYLMMIMPAELAPMEDNSVVLSIVSAPSASNRAYMQEQLDQIQTIFNNTPEKKAYLMINGVPTSNQAFAIMVLNSWEQRQRSQTEVVAGLMPEMMAIPGAQIFPIEPPPLPISGADPVAFIVQHSGSYQELAELMDTIKQEVAKNPNLTNARSDLDMDTPQLSLTIRRDIAADMRLDVGDIMDTISVMMGGRKVTELESGAKNYTVKIQLDAKDRRNTDQMQDIYVRNRDGDMIALTNLIEVKEKVGAQSLAHYNRLRSSTLTLGLAPGYSQSQAVEFLEQVANKTLNDQAQYAWGGQVKEYLNASGDMVTTTLLALIFIYLVLAAQFESFRDPLIIMLTVPFSIVGAVLALHFTGGTNNLYTQIGFVTLIGLVTKHGILITEFANQLQQRGLSVSQAIVESAGTRIRPILMTTGAMVLGALPLAIATGAGAQARQQLGWTIVGGMSIGTIFSLIVVPLAYSIIASRVNAGQSEDS